MSATTTTTADHVKLQTDPPSSEPVMGEINYIPENHVPEPSPYNFHLPVIAEFSDRRTVPLRNMRPLPDIDQLYSPEFANHVHLKTHGFTALYHPTTLNKAPYNTDSGKDPKLLKEYYIPDTVEMLKRVTGCKTVVTEMILIRSQLWSEKDALATHAGHGLEDDLSEEERQRRKELTELETGFPQYVGFNPTQGGASPAPKPHVDYAPAGARLHLRAYHPDMRSAAQPIITAEDALTSTSPPSSIPLKQTYHSSSPTNPRWALFSIWRPLKPVHRDPLALLDPRTCIPSDYVPVSVKMPYLGDESRKDETHSTESFLARYSKGQQWNWIENQQPEEVLVIGLFDSRAEAEGEGCLGLSGGGTLHSSVDLIGQEKVKEARESLELRCLCIWE